MECNLLKRLKCKDESAYVELFDLHYKYLHTVASNYVLDCDIADDMVQETFIHLFSNIEGLNDIKNYRSYLRVSVRNRCISYLRQLDIEDAHKLLYIKEQDAVGIETEDAENLTAPVIELLNTLPFSCRQVCKLRFLDGYKIEEISEQLSLSPNTIKVHIHRGVSKMRTDIFKGSELYKRLAKCVKLFVY